VRFLPDDGPAVSQSLSVAPGSQVLLADVVSTLGGDGVGAVEILADPPVLASSRTFNQSASGSFGQFLGAAHATELMAEGGTRTLLHLVQNQGFRTNIGLHNTSVSEATVELRLHDSSGTLVTSSSRTLEPGQRLQLNEPFAAAGRSDIDAGYAEVGQRTGSGVAVYASVVDNLSNDPTTIPALR
jgi:hypothetical protein